MSRIIRTDIWILNVEEKVLEFREGTESIQENVLESVDSRVGRRLDSLIIKFPESLRVIRTEAFRRRNEIVAIVFKKKCNLHRVDVKAFEDCNRITHLDFRNTQLDHISFNAFMGCSSLEECLLPDTINYIGVDAFANCSELKEIDLKDATMVKGNSFRNCEKLKTLKIGGNLDEQTRFNPEAFMVADLDFNIELTNIPGVDSDYANSLCFRRNYRYGVMEVSLGNRENGSCTIACVWGIEDPTSGPIVGDTWRVLLKDYVFINSRNLNHFIAATLDGNEYQIDLSNIFFGYKIGIKPFEPEHLLNEQRHVALYTGFAEMVNYSRPDSFYDIDELVFVDWKGNTIHVDHQDYDNRRTLGGLLLQNPNFAAVESDMRNFRFYIPRLLESKMIWPASTDGNVQITIPNIQSEELPSCFLMGQLLEWAMVYHIDFSEIMISFNENPSPQGGPAPKTPSPLLDEDDQGGPAPKTPSPIEYTPTLMGHASDTGKKYFLASETKKEKTKFNSAISNQEESDEELVLGGVAKLLKKLTRVKKKEKRKKTHRKKRRRKTNRIRIKKHKRKSKRKH